MGNQADFLRLLPKNFEVWAGKMAFSCFTLYFLGIQLVKRHFLPNPWAVALKNRTYCPKAKISGLLISFQKSFSIG